MDMIEIHNNYINKLKEDNNHIINSEDKWHFNRRLGIGGSDMGAILGLNKYKTSYDIWKDKLDIDVSRKTSEPAYWGTVLEDVVANEFSKRNNIKLTQYDHSFHLKDNPWCAANIDRFIWQDNKTPIYHDKVTTKHILECKTAGAFVNDWGDEDSDEIPYSYLIQCQWYLRVVNADICFVALLKGGQKYLQFKVVKDTNLQDILVEKATEFWFDNVISNTPPTPKSLREVNQYFKKDNSESCLSNNEITSSINEIKKLKESEKSIKKEIEAHENIIKQYLGSNAIIKDSCGDALATWKNQKTKRFNSKEFKKDNEPLYNKYIKETESRVFKIK